MATYTPFIDPSVRPADLVVDSFSTEGGNIATQAVTTVFDLYAPNELLAVFQRHNHDPGFRMMLKSMGFSRGTYKPTTGHYEWPWRENLLEVGTIITAVDPGAGGDVEVELDAAAMYDTTLTASGSPVKGSYPIVGEVVYLQDRNKARIMSKDTTVDPHRVTLRPLDSTVSIFASLTASTAYFLASNMHPEGSGLPSGRFPRIITYLNEFQIIKHSAGTTGSNLTNRMYFDVIPGVQGSIYLKIKDDMLYRFENSCSEALIFGGQADNISVFDADLGFDVPVAGTEGMVDFSILNGNTVTYVPGSTNLQTYDTPGNIFEDERVKTRDICGFVGKLYYDEFENVNLAALNNDLAALLATNLLNYPGSTIPAAGPYDEFQPLSASDWCLQCKFKGIQKGTYNYLFKFLHEFNYVMGAGATGYDFKQWAIMAPVGFVEDAVYGGRGAMIGYEFKELNGYSRENVPSEIVGSGANSPGQLIVSDQFDRRKAGMVAEIAFHGACANQFVIHKP